MSKKQKKHGSNELSDEDKLAEENGTTETEAATPEASDENLNQQADEDVELSHEELLLTVQDAQEKADEYWNQLLRAKAELENQQRRAQRDLENAHQYGLEKIVNELLPVKDSLELGLAAAQEADADSEKVKEGIDLTLKMLCTAMEKIGVSEINPEGEKFNPEFHQAMTTQEAEDVEPNTVLTVFQKGYLLNKRLVRPAMVIVSSAIKKENDKKIDETA